VGTAAFRRWYVYYGVVPDDPDDETLHGHALISRTNILAQRGHGLYLLSPPEANDTGWFTKAYSSSALCALLRIPATSTSESFDPLMT
jgi:hypothetical protein